MRRLSPTIATLVALTLSIATANAQRADDGRAAAAQVEDALFARQVALAETAFEHGLLREAVRLARTIRVRDAGHALVVRADALRTLPVDEFLSTYEQGLQQHGRSFHKEMQRQLAPLVARFDELGEAALRLDDDEFAVQMFARAFEVDPDDRRALQALRKLDHDVIFNYGVLPKVEKVAARATLRTLGGRFLERRDLQDELEYWSDAWGLQTRHYRFVTNAPHNTVFAFAQTCENMHTAWEQWMRDNKQALRSLTRPLTVYLFDSPLAYETVLRLGGEQPLASDSYLGYYSPQTRASYFYCDADFYGGDTALLFETFYHEGAHQLFDLRYKSPWRGPARDHPLHWVEEGVCCYLETLQFEPQDGETRAVFGGIVDDDLGIGARAAGTDALMPANEFAHLSEAAWNDYENGYQHAALLIHWLMHAEDGKLRPKVFELLLAERQNGGLRKGSLFELLGRPADKVDEQLMEYAGQLQSRLPWRKYAEDR